MEFEIEETVHEMHKYQTRYFSFDGYLETMAHVISRNAEIFVKATTSTREFWHDP